MFVDKSINLAMPIQREYVRVPEEQMKDVKLCPICKDANFVDFFTDIEAARMTTHWKLCEECGHVFLSPAPTEKWLGSYYAEGYRQDTEGNEDPEKIPERGIKMEAKRGMRQASNLMRFTDNVTRVLDIGCSSGVAIACIFDRYKVKHAVGVEPNHCYRAFAEKMSAKAPELPGKVKLVEKLSDVPKSPKFDYVIISHTLEHVLNPTKFLVSCKQYLLNRGLMMIEVPYIFGGAANPLLFPHLHGFHPRTLVRCIEEAGMYVVHHELFSEAAGPLWPSPRAIYAIASKIEWKPTLDNMLHAHNLYRFHLKFILAQIEASKNPLTKFG